MAEPISRTAPGPWWLVAVALGFLAMNGLPAIASHLELRWPDVGLGGAIFIGLFLAGRFVSAGDGSHDRVLTLHWVLLLVYLIHQFEEHGVDLYGRVYHFQTYANAALEPRGLELTRGAILRINTLLVWGAFLIAVWGGRRFPWPGLAAAGLTLTNGLFHIGIALGRGEYNPGLATALLLFLPVAVGYFRVAPREFGLGGTAIAAAVGFGLFGHSMLPLLIGADAPLLAVALLAVAPLAANLIAVRIRGPRSAPA